MMSEAILAKLKSYDINIDYLREKSYDNTSNMEGCYFGLQTVIKTVNPFAKFVPCSAHSLKPKSKFW